MIVWMLKLKKFVQPFINVDNIYFDNDKCGKNPDDYEEKKEKMTE